MGNRGDRFVLCLFVVWLMTTGLGPRAEVTADTTHNIILLILGITEGPDPIPQVIWESVRYETDPEHPEDFPFMLNFNGALRGDGRPDDACHPGTNWAHVVWAFDDGPDHEIAHSEWMGDKWSDVSYLTSSDSDEIDPRISISSDGTIYVAWWDAVLEQVWMSTRASGISAWNDPEPVTGLVDSGRRPSIIEWDGTVLAAYERSSIRWGQEIVVATRVSAGVYTTNVVSTTQSQAPLNVILHEEAGVLWIDWRHSDTEYAYSIYANGVWGTRVTLSWIADSWTRAEEVRQIIRGVVLSR